MSKLNKIEHYHKDTGEIITSNMLRSIKKEEQTNTVKRVYYLKENNPEKLQLADIELLMKLEKLPNKTPNTIKLDFKEDGFFTCRRDLNLVLNLHDYTKAFLYSISHMITHDGRLKYNNNKIVPNLSNLKKYLKISNDKWNKYIRRDIEKYSIVKKEKIDNRWCLLLNPIYATTTRTMTETMFIAFHKELKGYLHELEYMYLKKFHGIDVD